MAIAIRQHVHEAALLLTDNFGGDESEAMKQAGRKSLRAKELNLEVEWNHWGAVAAYLMIIDSGAEFDIQG